MHLNPHITLLLTTYRALKASASSRTASAKRRFAATIAARHVKAMLESQLDMFARLQYIEGLVAEPFQWSKRGNPTQGLAKAAEYIAANYPSADMDALTSGRGWLSPRNTGFFAAIMKPVGGMLADHPYADYDDVAQQMVMGAKRKMGWASLFHYAAAKDRKSVGAVMEGLSTPGNKSLIGRLRRWAVQAAGKYIRSLERSQAAEEVSGLVMDDSDESVWNTAMPGGPTRSEDLADMILFPDDYVRDDAEVLLEELTSVVKSRNLINGIIMQAFLEVARSVKPSPSNTFRQQVAKAANNIINERYDVVMRVLRSGGKRDNAMADALESGDGVDETLVASRMQTVQNWLAKQDIEQMFLGASDKVREAYTSFLRKLEAYRRQRVAGLIEEETEPRLLAASTYHNGEWASLTF